MFKKILRLSCPALLLSSACALAIGHTPGSHSNFTYPDPPAGFDAFHITLDVNRDPGAAADLFWSNQFGFNTNFEYGYIGMQSIDVDPKKRLFLFSVWNATEAKVGSTGTYCIPFTEGVAGYSCRLNHFWSTGGSYTFNVEHTGGGWFTGRLIATQPDGTVEEFVLGSVKTTANQLTTFLQSWTEYFEWGSNRATCLGQPYSSVQFSFPTGISGGNRWQGQIADTGAVDDCKDFSSVAVLDTGAVQRNGMGNSLRGLLESKADQGCLTADSISEAAGLSVQTCRVRGESGWVYSKAGSLEIRDNYCLASSEPDLGDLALRTCDHTNPNFHWDISKGGQIKKGKTDMCLTDRGTDNKVTLLRCTGAANQRWSVNQLGRNNSGCIVSLDSGEKYCMWPGDKKAYALPSSIYKNNVYVSADRGTSVILSDWDNLSYNRTATFNGTVVNDQLKNVKADNGEFLDFSRPASMRVVTTDTPLGCIVKITTSQQFCLPAGGNAGYDLPAWIKGADVYVEADEGVSVTLSDWSNLSYGRTATFTHYVSNANLKNVKADNGEYLNFNQPYSMRVNAE